MAALCRGTGDTYVGRASSPEHHVERQRAHDRSFGTTRDYHLLDRAQPGRGLQVAEESQIRSHGGSRRDGGGLVNKRHEMSEKRYRAIGGRAGPPLGSRLRR